MVGLGRAMDMILTGRGVNAEEAHGWGLANRLTPAGDALATAIALAKDIAAFRKPACAPIGPRRTPAGAWNSPKPSGLKPAAGRRSWTRRAARARPGSPPARAGAAGSTKSELRHDRLKRPY